MPGEAEICEVVQSGDVVGGIQASNREAGEGFEPCPAFRDACQGTADLGRRPFGLRLGDGVQIGSLGWLFRDGLGELLNI